MHMANTGKEYELFVAKIQQALLYTETIGTLRKIQVEVNKKIKDNCGIERQFDIYWEYELGGITYKTVIECKDYNSTISVEKIDALIGKIRDLPDLKAVFATKRGYQSGARIKAEKNRIDLLVVRQQNDTDWKDEDGNPRIKKVCINTYWCMPAHIQKIDFMIDNEWEKENTAKETTKQRQISGMNSEILIEDIDANETYSLQELASRLTPLESAEYGVFEIFQELRNAFLRHEDLRLKLSGYRIEYSITEPVSEITEIDFSEELIGVVEYLNKGTKKSIFRDGSIK